MKASPLSLPLLALLNACRCTTPVQNVEEGRLSVSPTSVVLAPSYVGQRTSAEVVASNEGQAPLELEVTATPPFMVDASTVKLVRGEGVTLSVSLTAHSRGPSVECCASEPRRSGCWERCWRCRRAPPRDATPLRGWP